MVYRWADSCRGGEVLSTGYGEEGEELGEEEYRSVESVNWASGWHVQGYIYCRTFAIWAGK